MDSNENIGGLRHAKSGRSICTVPWDDAGAYLRFSVTYQAPTEAEEDALMVTLKKRLGEDSYLW